MFSVLPQKGPNDDVFNHTCDVFCQKLISYKSRVEKKHLEERIKERSIELKLVKRMEKTRFSKKGQFFC